METKRSRGFGFVVFTSSEIVEKVILSLPCNHTLTLFPGLDTKQIFKSGLSGFNYPCPILIKIEFYQFKIQGVRFNQSATLANNFEKDSFMLGSITQIIKR